MDKWTASILTIVRRRCASGMEGIADRAWFPDEDMYRLANTPDWVKRQRKISKKAALGCALSGQDFRT
jgi:hypothetical protein